jgi:DNA ligase D-like protein (predicted ligase)/DNA ligase D-like protein (predicted polymerase)/DNA ligase D-like protein (predicted 3'-phosphoesterase)
MSGKNEWVSVEDHRLKLTNLQKVLYPSAKITKAEIIKYYLNIASVMLPHIQGRPLTLLRYPDGINDKHFFQKDAPKGKPDWIDFETLGESEENDYLIADEQAALVWLANLASLEIHQMSSRRPHFEQPDYMAFDLDPPEKTDFERITNLAFNLKKHIENYGYHPFVKTSGGKGLHIVMPLEPQGNMEAVFEAAKELAQVYVEEHQDETTLNFKKKARKGRIFIDVLRNRKHQIMISPYSLRGSPGAPVSMPLRWEELSDIEGSGQFNLKNAIDKIKDDGDAWQDINDHASPLHIQKSSARRAKKDSPKSGHKSPDQLNEYQRKRDFDKTGEPEAADIEESGNRFVIQRHHASRLHYDLRLEREGALQSWAVPKGLPPRPGIKRLAVETEDHPLNYLTFEGNIPEDEYGGGQVWIFSSGKYEMVKQKKGSLHFNLQGEALSGEYHLYRTNGDQWLLEKKNKVQSDWLKEPVEPMLGKRTDHLPDGNYCYEVKWDGIRALVALDEDQIKIHTRNNNEVTKQFPELLNSNDLRSSSGLFDGEIVYLNAEGKPDFQKIIKRLKYSSERSQKPSDSIVCYLFDCLYLDGRPLVDEPLEKRQEWLSDVIKKGRPYRFSEPLEDGEKLLSAIEEQNMEGVMAKKKGSKYRAGKRSDAWVKVKSEQTIDCFIIGYTQGEGGRSSYFGALHLAEKDDDGSLNYRGKVGTGFNQTSLKEIHKLIKELDEIDKPINHPVQNEKETTWVEPKIVIEVHYAELTDDKLLRQAVFKRFRPDLSV